MKTVHGGVIPTIVPGDRVRIAPNMTGNERYINESNVGREGTVQYTDLNGLGPWVMGSERGFDGGVYVDYLEVIG